MHPILSDKYKVFIYLIVWGCIGILSGLIISIFNAIHPLYSIAYAFPMMVLYGEMNLSVWYICRAFPLERTMVRKLFAAVISAAALLSALWTLLGWGWMTVLDQLFSVTLSPLPLRQSLFIMFGIGGQLSLLAIAVSYLLSAFERSKESERTVFEARLLAQEAELKALRMQIDPHFLFNSLNSISALTSTNAMLARSMTTTLADYFRTSLSYGSKETISLKEELSLLNHYLDIEKIRFGSRLIVDQHIQSETLSDQIPPLLLQPLLENAIKHGIANTVEGGTISIFTQKKNGKLFITIENPFDADAPGRKGAGMGLAIVKKRLQTLFGADGDLITTANGTVFHTVLFFPVSGKV